MAQRRRVQRFGRLATATAVAGAVLAGLTGGAAPAQAVDATVPAWLVPLSFSDDGRHRACTGIVLSASRALAAPDCFTGRSGEDTAWEYTLATGALNSGVGGPRYRVHPRYDYATGAAGIAVTQHGMNTPASARPSLASAGDASLYAPGVPATFYSWTGATADSERARHAERAVVRSAADCAALLGRTLPAGMLCTSPAAGTAPAPADERCVGDAGGALVAGGKLIAISATRVNGCAAEGVRLYTNLRTYRPQVIEGARDVEVSSTWGQSGTVIAREGNGLVDVCGTDVDGRRDCGADSIGLFNDWNNEFNYLSQLGDSSGDGQGDLLGRAKDGRLHRFVQPENEGRLDRAAKVQLGSGWNIYNRIVPARDISGDGYPDILARDGSGVLWLYRGTADGKLAARTKSGTGWGSFTALTGRGDLSGDGRSDLIARDAAGVLWLYRGNGKGGFAPRTKVSSGWNAFNVIVASGDMDADGRQDFVARTPAGAAYLYNADNKGGFPTRKQLATTQWKGYVSIG
ncbi:FG-GAP-like repeat-containing protein [Streptomyces sp. SYSU K217416]